MKGNVQKNVNNCCSERTRVPYNIFGSIRPNCLNTHKSANGHAENMIFTHQILDRHLPPAASTLQLLKSGTLSLQLFECAPAPTFFIVITRLTVSSRPSNPINAFLLTTQIRLLLTIVRGYKLYLLTYLFIYRFVNVRGGFSMREPRDE